MPLTRDYRETLLERAQDEPEFGHELLKGAVRSMLNGEPKIGRFLLHDCVYATIGFDELSQKIGKQRDDLDHMLSSDEDPSAGDLLGIIAAVSAHEGIALDVQVVPRGHYERQLAASLVWHPDPCDTVAAGNDPHR